VRIGIGDQVVCPPATLLIGLTGRLLDAREPNVMSIELHPCLSFDFNDMTKNSPLAWADLPDTRATYVPCLRPPRIARRPHSLALSLRD